ncbi:MAG: aldo/keto reductase [Candidatus Riflebacteria bacterium]|nr:aldo/keto reductase [Candidatus Riflebacteria bacterium]
MGLNRRDFLKYAAGLLGTTLLPVGRVADLFAAAATMPMRTLGRTGAKVSWLGLGGFNVGIDSFTDETAVDFIHYALDHGVTFLDNSREYVNGRAEDRMGKALQGTWRDKAFLMTKNCAHDRSYAGSMRSLEESLRALRTDHLDLWMFHEINYADDPAALFDRGGIQAALDARAQGKVRFIGFSGHKDPELHLELLRRPFPWDAVMIPLGIMDWHDEKRSFTRRVLPVLKGRNIGIIGFKTQGGFLSGVPEKIGVSHRDCIRYAMGHNPSVVLVGMESMAQLEENLETIMTARPMTPAEQRKVVAKGAKFAHEPRMEIYKNTPDYDSALGKELHGIR